MRVPFLIVFISAFARIANASAYAKVPELYTWYAVHQMEFYAYGGGNTNMATSCSKAGDTTPCTLLQFIRKTILAKHNQDFTTGYNRLSEADKAFINTVDPDLTQADRVLNTVWDDWTRANEKTKVVSPVVFFKGVYDGTKLYAGYPKDMGPLVSQFYEAVTNDIQQTRKDVQNGEALVASVDTWFTRAKLGFMTAHGNRIADQSEGLVRSLGNLFGTNLKTMTVTLPTGRIYNGVDTKATMTASGIVPGSATETQWLEAYAGWTKQREDLTGLTDDQKADIRHQKILNVLSTSMSRMLSTPDC